MQITLRKGTKGNEVKELQKILGINSDGDFGRKTEAAVKKWAKNKQEWDVPKTKPAISKIDKQLSEYLKGKQYL